MFTETMPTLGQISTVFKTINYDNVVLLSN